ncbi:MAG: hypothetical protein E7388_00915 [Ruminococcaceae bacterium]|nr:hypothetical protein [Oscillospiraceae bacterium]
MKAIVLADSEGLRLRPMTVSTPKAMLTLAGVPLLEHIINQLKKYDVKDITIVLGYFSSKIRSYFNNGEEFGVKIKYYTNENKYSDFSCVLNCTSEKDDEILFFNCDCYSQLDIKKFIEFHVLNKNVCSYAFAQFKSHCIIFNKKVFDYIINNNFLDIEKDVIPMLSKKIGNVCRFRHKEICLPLFSIADYLKANIFCASRCGSINGSVVFEDNVIITEPVYIGKNVYVGKGSRIGPGAIVREGTVIGNDVSVTGSVVLEDCNISSGCTIKSSVLCGGIDTGRNTVISESVIGERAVIESYCYITDNTKIWPGLKIEEDSELTKVVLHNKTEQEYSFVSSWTTGWKFFCKKSTEAVRFGYIYGKMTGKGASVFISFYDKGFCSGAMHGIISGLNAAGCNVYTVKNSTQPLFRWSVKKGFCDGSVHIESHGEYCFISITDGYGNEPDSEFRNEFTKKFFCTSYPVINNSNDTFVTEFINPFQLYQQELNTLFKEADKTPFPVYRYFTQKEKEGIIAEIMAEFHPDSPVFVSTASRLPANYICDLNGSFCVESGSLPGDVMSEMENNKDDPGVLVQYHMLFDDLAFELGLMHYRNLGFDVKYCIEKIIPGVYTSERILLCGNKIKNDLIEYINGLIELESNKSGITVSSEANSNKLKIYAESLNSEFAGEICDKLETYAKEWMKNNS